MTHSLETLAEQIGDKFGDAITQSRIALGELTIEVAPGQLHQVCKGLRDEPRFGFEQLIDLCGVDYAAYGQACEVGEAPEPRCAVVYHLMSVRHNQRLRVRVYLDDAIPSVDSVMDIWSCANWYEREAFDLFGIIFEGHPDLRRLLTDYGFIGHPFRKNFPLSGHVEMRYDPEKGRVVYQPVSIDPRIIVPRVIREEGFGGRDS